MALDRATSTQHCVLRAAVHGALSDSKKLRCNRYGASGKSAIRLVMSLLIDPDGFAVECNQLLSPLS